MMPRLLTLVLAFFSLTSASLSADNDAGSESPFALGAGARALGMGGAFTALADDASLIYYNPSHLPILPGQEVTFMHATLFAGTRYDFAAWAIPISSNYGTGISFMRIGTDDIVARQNFIATDTLSFSHTQISFSYGRKLVDRVSIGGSFKVINQSLADLSDYAYGADLALSSRINNFLTLGLMARDLLAPKLVLDSTSERSSRTFVAGLAAREVAVSDHLRFNLAFDLEKTQNRNLKVHSGVEAIFHEKYAIRAGYDRDNFAVGAGLRINNLRIDYALRFLDYLDDSHRFSLTWLVGKSGESDRVIHDTIAVPTERILTEEELAAQQAKQTGHIFFQKAELDSALHYYQLSLNYDSTDQEARRMVGAIVSAREADQTRQVTDSLVEREQFTDRYYNQAYQFYSKKYYLAALDLLNIVLEIDPGYSRATELMAEIEKAKQAEIADFLAQAELARTEERLIDEITTYNRILDLDAENDEVLQAKARAIAGLDLTQQLNLGIRLFGQGRYEAARRRFEAVLKLSADDQVAIEYIARIESAETGPSSLDELQQNKEIWALYLQGIRYMRGHEYEQAIRVWERVLEAFPSNVNTLNNLEQARLRLQSDDDQ